MDQLEKLCTYLTTLNEIVSLADSLLSNDSTAKTAAAKSTTTAAAVNSNAKAKTDEDAKAKADAEAKAKADAEAKVKADKDAKKAKDDEAQRFEPIVLPKKATETDKTKPNVKIEQVTEAKTKSEANHKGLKTTKTDDELKKLGEKYIIEKLKEKNIEMKNSNQKQEAIIKYIYATITKDKTIRNEISSNLQIKPYSKIKHKESKNVYDKKKKRLIREDLFLPKTKKCKYYIEFGKLVEKKILT